MSDTPETDLLVLNQHHDCVPYDESANQLAKLCRKLERERNEWIARFRADEQLIKDAMIPHPENPEP